MKFLRRSHDRYAKLGKGVKKNQKWRRPAGRDNKMREKRRGYPAVISVGYKKDKKLRGTLNEKKPVMINQIVDLEKLAKDEIAVIGSVGKKRKLEIARAAKEKKIELYNMNAEKFLKIMQRTKSSASPKKPDDSSANEKKAKEIKKKVGEKTESKTKTSEDKKWIWEKRKN